jgi:hypothetical protein
LDAASGLASGYVNSNCDGDDGAPLTDYDLIGRAEDRTGLFSRWVMRIISISCACRP